jgi:hypothetical protein
MNRFLSLMTAVCGVALASTANASLLARDVSGLPGVTDAYYDTDLNITWLRDSNYAATSGFSAGGLMNFSTAQSWASGLNINGITGWRLADVGQPDASCGAQDAHYGSTGTNCTGGELGHMYYVEMGGTAGTSLSASHNSNYILFDNLGDNEYWSATALTPNTDDPRSLSYFFYEANNGDGSVAGIVSLDFPTNTKLGWVVHDGDVEVPEPASLVILSSGMVFLAIKRRKRHAA